MTKNKKKQVRFRLEEIPIGGYMIKGDYAIYKSKNGDIYIAGIETIDRKDKVLINKAEEKKVFVVYNMQRWDSVRLIKGYTNKEEAEKHRKELEEKETVYDEVYCVEEIKVKSVENGKKETTRKVE